MFAHVSYEEDVQCAIDEQEIAAICELVLVQEGVSRPCYVSLSTVDEERMRELNQEWRSQDRSTDVISLECERPDDPDLAEGEPCELGDIVLAPTYIARQAATYGTTAADETRLLLIHGLLHLLGYDHLTDDEAEFMEAREDKLLAMCATDASMAKVNLTRHEGE